MPEEDLPPLPEPKGTERTPDEPLPWPPERPDEPADAANGGWRVWLVVLIIIGLIVWYAARC